MQEFRVQSPPQKGLLEKEMATVPVFFLGKPMERGAWRATVHWVAKELHMTWQLKTHINSQFPCFCVCVCVVRTQDFLSRQISSCSNKVGLTIVSKLHRTPQNIVILCLKVSTFGPRSPIYLHHVPLPDNYHPTVWYY